jgi:carbon-monoxide dehydrogenase medium subunit
LSLLYDAQIEVAGTGNTRRKISIQDFIAGFMMPNIEAHEIVAAVELPLWNAGHGYAFHEFSRRHGDFALASAACLVERAGGGAIKRVAIAVGGVGPVPQRLPSAEVLFTGTHGEAGAIEAALELCSGLEIVGDFHGGVEFRLNAARSMLRRSLKLAMTRAGFGND